MVTRRCFGAGALGIVTVLACFGSPAGAQGGGDPVKISNAHGGGQANGDSHLPVVSRNGDFIAYSSDATNLVSANDTNSAADAFLREQGVGTTRVSKKSDGTQGNGDSWAEAVANDGTVTFFSWADNLVSGDTNSTGDVFVHKTNGNTDRISVSSSGGQANDYSGGSSISNDGNLVTFTSSATNLVSPFSGVYGLYLHNVSTGNTKALVTTSTWPIEDAMISGDGEWVVFQTIESLLPADTDETYDVYRYEVDDETTELVSVTSTGNIGEAAWQPYVSNNGRYVVFGGNDYTSGDDTWTMDVYLRDYTEDTIEIVSLSSGEVQGDEWSQFPEVSDDGQYVMFHSQAVNLIADDDNGMLTDVFVRDRTNGTTIRVEPSWHSLLTPPGEPDGETYMGGLHPGGEFVVFYGPATNMVTGDTNGDYDVFSYDL